MGLAHSPKIVTDGLVLCLDAADIKSYPGSGTAWKNRSGDGNTGTLTNGPTFDSSNGGSIDFDGTNDKVVIPNYTALSPTDELTIEAWVNFDGNNQDFIFEKGAINSQYSLFSSGTNICFRSKHGSSLPTLLLQKSSAGISNGTWHHIVASWDGSNKRLYVDSNLVGTSAQTGSLATTTGAAAVGSFGNYTAYPFSGKIAAVRIYNKGLAAEEALQNYNATKSRFGL